MTATLNRLLIAYFCAILYVPFTTTAQVTKPANESYEQPKTNNPTDANRSNEINKGTARNGTYDKIAQPQREFLPYKYIREADVFWQKRVWRVIDTRQKMNHTFTYSKQPFIAVLLDIIQKHPDASIFIDDEFTMPTTYAEVSKQIGGADSVKVVNPDTGEEIWKVVTNDFDWASVKRFRLKEDWIFDQSDSRMVVRILGIAPIREVYDKNGEYRGDQAMFWLYYPSFRQYLIKYETFNPFNDSNRLTWDDLLEMRMFSSYIMKESNVQDRRIQDYKNGRDALLESEAIKRKMLDFYENLWSY